MPELSTRRASVAALAAAWLAVRAWRYVAGIRERAAACERAAAARARCFKVCIVGGGMSGIAQAVALARAGIPFEIIEQASDYGGAAAAPAAVLRVSKSGGSFVLQAVVLFVGPIASAQGILPIAMVFGVVTALWIHAAISAAIFIGRNSPDTNLTTDTSSLV